MRAHPDLTHAQTIERKRRGIVYVMRNGRLYEKHMGGKRNG